MPQTWRMNPAQPAGALDSDTLARGEAGAAPLAWPLFYEAELNKDRFEQAIWENGLITGAVTRPATKTFAESGYTPQEMASRMPDLYNLSHPDDVDVLRQAVRDDPSGVTPQYRCEFRLLCSQGVWVWFTNDGCIMDSHAATSGRRLIGVKFNIDDRKRAWRSRTHSPACAIGARSCHSAMRSADAPRCRGRHRGQVRGQGVCDRVARDGQTGALKAAEFFHRKVAALSVLINDQGARLSVTVSLGGHRLAGWTPEFRGIGGPSALPRQGHGAQRRIQRRWQSSVHVCY